MGFKTALNSDSAQFPRAAEAAQEFQAIRAVSERALADLPSHRTLVDHQLAVAVGSVSAQAALQ
jgi:tryptophan halogenase